MDFPAPAMPDQPDHFARFDFQREIVQHALRFVVSERNIVEFDRAFDMRHGNGVNRVAHVGFRIEDFEDALRRCRRAGHPVENPAEVLERAVKLTQIAAKRGEFSESSSHD